MEVQIYTRSCVYTSFIDNEIGRIKITRLKILQRKTVKIVLDTTPSVLYSEKFLSHKNIFTHSFISIDDYPMSEVLN
jgi:hypothetical protein